MIWIFYDSTVITEALDHLVISAKGIVIRKLHFQFAFSFPQDLIPVISTGLLIQLRPYFLCLQVKIFLESQE